MAWLTQWWTFLATLIVVFVPGLVAAFSLGLRRLGLWAFAPVASVAMISVLAAVYGFVHVPWNLLTAGAGLAVMAAVLVGARFALRMPVARPRVTGARWPVPVALVAAFVLIAVRVVVYIGDPTDFSQTNDAVFHLGAVRAIISTGHASSFGLAGLIDPTARGGFYPGAWHATASLVALAGGDITIAANMLTVVIAGIVWPLGIAWLTQIATGRRLAAAVAAAITPTIVIFPLLMMQYGVLYAYFLGVAVLPAAIAVVIALTRRRWSADAPLVGRTAALAIGVALALAALGFAQPSVVLAWGLCVWLYGAGHVVQQWRRRAPRRGLWTVALGLGLVALAVTWWRMRHLVTADVWHAVRGGKDALIEMLSAGFVKTPSAWWVTALLVVGLVAVLRRARTRWMAFAWLAFFVLAFVAYAVRNRSIRILLVGPWYSDPYRLAALVPVMMIPIAAAGVVLLVDLCVLAVVRRRRRTGAPGASPRVVATRFGAGAVAALVLIATVVVALQPLVLRFKLLDDFAETESPYWVTANAWLSADERALIARLPGDVEPGARILANPHTGAALAYYLSGVDVYPAKWQVPTDAAYTLLRDHLHEATTDPAVCDAVRTLGAQYVLDFGYIDPNAPGTFVPMPGFTDFDGVPGFELVDSEGDASLWRITACS